MHYRKQCKDRCHLQKNIRGKKEAFQRDIAEKNSHTGRHNTDNSLRTKEGNGSNRYNDSDTNREHDPHRRYQPRNTKKPIQPIQQIQKKTISPKIINLSK